MPFRRRILRYGPSPEELRSAVEDRAIAGCSFELLRLGGCGRGEVRLKDSFITRDDLQVGEWIACEYDDDDRWYLGRIEERHASSPAGVVLRLEGMGVQLGEVYPGGFGLDEGRAPHRYGLSDERFLADPDYAQESFDHADSPAALVRLLLDQYVVPSTDIRLESGFVEDGPDAELVSLKFNGEETVRSILKDLALRLRDASWGVDELGRFFFLQRRTALLATYQEGVDLVTLREEQTRAMLYNRVLLTGGYVYGAPAIDSEVAAAVRWRGNYRQPASISNYGERRIRLSVPWIRTAEDSRQFVREFFHVYANPARVVDCDVVGRSTCPRPWLGAVRVLDRAGSELARAQVDVVRVQFDTTPRLRLTIGPEDPRTHWPEPDHDERFPIARRSVTAGLSGGGSGGAGGGGNGGGGDLTLTQGRGHGSSETVSSDGTSGSEDSADSEGSELSSLTSIDSSLTSDESHGPSGGSSFGPSSGAESSTSSADSSLDSSGSSDASSVSSDFSSDDTSSALTSSSTGDSLSSLSDDSSDPGTSAGSTSLAETSGSSLVSSESSDVSGTSDSSDSNELSSSNGESPSSDDSDATSAAGSEGTAESPSSEDSTAGSGSDAVSSPDQSSGTGVSTDSGTDSGTTGGTLESSGAVPTSDSGAGGGSTAPSSSAVDSSEPGESGSSLATTEAGCFNCDAVPVAWRVVVSGVTDGDCTTCSGFNGTFVLDFTGSFEGACFWFKSLSACGDFGPATVQLDYADATRALSFRVEGMLVARYECQTLWACLGTNVFDLVEVSNICQTWPATLTVVAT